MWPNHEVGSVSASYRRGFSINPITGLSTFIRVHLAVLAGTDFFTVEVLTLRWGDGTLTGHRHPEHRGTAVASCSAPRLTGQHRALMSAKPAAQVRPSLRKPEGGRTFFSVRRMSSCV
jgi:hypothetical protein